MSVAPRRGYQRGWMQALLGGALQQDRSEWAETDVQEVTPDGEEEPYCAPRSERIPQRGCGVPLTGDSQKLSGHSCVPCARE